MIKIPISLIKKLRNRTNISITECKQALIKANGDIQIAIDNMKKQGAVKTIKKSKRATQEGLIFIKTTQNKKYGIILELSCETDFVRNNDIFKKFGDSVINMALKDNIVNLNTLQEKFREKTNMLISIFDENINIQRINCIQGEIVESYLHNNKKFGVIVSFSGKQPIKEKLLKHIAMHITANKPKYINSQQIPEDALNNEKNIQRNLAIQKGQSSEIAEMIAQGYINKFINEISLLNQPFIMDTKKTITDLLNENNIKINQFTRFEVGEKT